jgi:hypothetical protein
MSVQRADHTSRGTLAPGASNECDTETSAMRRPLPASGRSATGKKMYPYAQYVKIISVHKMLKCF